ncbi:hypothetical protein OAK47_01145 [Planctomycetaceae bacterium]|jgi:hypothetical protein|nr:hypothetical protein [Planctomycetaceae bacterium]
MISKLCKLVCLSSLLLVIGLQVGNPVVGVAQEAVPAAAAEAADTLKLPQEQEAIALRYERFENTMLKMAEYLRKTDPEQAELLVRGIGQSKSDRISGQMGQIVKLLADEQYGDAMDRETKVIKSLKSLLDLLESGDRRSELQAEQERIQQILKDLQITIGKSKDARASNERGDEVERAIEQQEIAEASGKKLVEKIDGQDAERQSKTGEEGEDSNNEPKEVKPGDPQEGEGEKGEGKEGEPKEGESGEGKPKEGESKPGEGDPKEGKSGEDKPKEGESGMPSEGEPQEGEPKEGKSQPGQPPKGESGESQEGQQDSGEQGEQADEEKTAGRDDIAQAVDRMNRAIEELKKKNRDNASREQSEAIAKLEEAKAKLEEILRQLREEERELLLAALEARFQKMLAMQVMVYTGTINLDKTPQPDWTSRHHARSRELAQTEDEIALEAVKALDLLKAEGSSIAFPEAIEQMRSDMLTVAKRLEQSQTGELTQVIEEDLIEALQEIVEALQKEMEKSEEEKEQQQQQQQQQSQQPPLVDKLAELKMLRSLQLRINRRTRVLAREFRGEAADSTDVVDQLHELSRRQSRIQKTTYDLATGRNQ